MKRTMGVVLALLMMALLLTTPALAKSRKAQVISGSVKVYEQASRTSRVLGSLSKGALVTVTAVRGNVARIKYAGKQGFVKKSALHLTRQGKADKAQQEQQEQQSARQSDTASSAQTKRTACSAIAYKKPSTGCRDSVRVRKGTSFTILDTQGEFYKVSRSGRIAYILKEAFVPKIAPAPQDQPIPVEPIVDTPSSGKPTPVRTPAPKPAQRSAADDGNKAKADQVIAAAMAQLGKPYVFGATGMSSFDCSGLTRYAYGKVGVSLPHSAYLVGYNEGKKVQPDELMRGDIVCFNTLSDSDLSDHVGIHLGNDQFIHASSGKGRVVVSDLAGFYQRVLSWGRRVL